METCSTCSFASSGKSKRRIRGGKKHNRLKKQKTVLSEGLERMSDILKEAKFKFGGQGSSGAGNGGTEMPPPKNKKSPYKHSLRTIIKEVEEKRKDTGSNGIFRKKEPGVVEYFHRPTRKEDLVREDGIAVELPDTVYDAPLQLSSITDKYASEMIGRTTTGGGVIPYMVLFRVRGTIQWKIPPPLKRSTIWST